MEKSGTLAKIKRFPVLNTKINLDYFIRWMSKI